jgi:thioredoxin-like negative regulator of GroEL
VFFLLFNIIKSQCIRDCSGHGRCIGFECHCAVGFDGEDCSVALTAMMDHEYVYPLLSVGDFNLTMQKYHKLLQNSHKKPFVIGFSSSGCQKCLQYEKEYMEIIPYLKSKKLKLTRVDLYHEKNLCRLLQINHVPSFMVIKDRKPRLFAGQEHTKDNLLAYIQKQLDPPVQLLNSIDQVHNFLGLHRRNQIHIVAFFQDAHDLEEDELLEYSEAAKTLQHQVLKNSPTRTSILSFNDDDTA